MSSGERKPYVHPEFEPLWTEYISNIGETQHIILSYYEEPPASGAGFVVRKHPFDGTTVESVLYNTDSYAYVEGPDPDRLGVDRHFPDTAPDVEITRYVNEKYFYRKDAMFPVPLAEFLHEMGHQE